MKNKNLSWFAALLVFALLLWCTAATPGKIADPSTYTCAVYSTIFSLLPPAQVAETLNDRLLADDGIAEYFTVVYAIADLQRGAVRMVQAGHPHPLLIRTNGEMEFIGGGGVPIGLIPGVEYQEVDFQMEPGDRLLLYTDGFTEARLKSGEMLEEEGLLRLVAAALPAGSGPEFMNDLYWRLTAEMEDPERMDDDVSATLFEYTGRPE